MRRKFLNSGISATPRSDSSLATVDLLIIDLSESRGLFAVAVLLGNKKDLFGVLKKALEWK